MKSMHLDLAKKRITVELPEQTDVLSISAMQPLERPKECIESALSKSIASPGLEEIIRSKLAVKRDAKAVVVVSDNTRPVPYKGEEGILWPIIERLLENKIPPARILILVATGTHRSLTNAELQEMIDPRVFENNIPIKSHDAKDVENLDYLGKTARGTKIYANADYMASDLKILTGLVESHFMAGYSGGRKSLCPGLTGEKTCYVFHGSSLLADENSRDLLLEGNPCHDEALAVAQVMGADYIMNVTLNHQFRLAGVFAGDMVKAHEAACAAVSRSVGIPFVDEYDLVITHAGHVGINHYQAAKAGVAAIPAVRPGGKLLMLANTADQNPIGSTRYRTILHLLKLQGPNKFVQLINSPSWEFVPEQWQVQMWARLFEKIPFQNFIYYAPQLEQKDYDLIPGIDGNAYLNSNQAYDGNIHNVTNIAKNVVEEILKELNVDQDRVAIAYLADGPYGIPYKKQSV